MRKRKAFFAGVAGALAMSFLMTVTRMAGVSVSLPMLLGTAFLMAPGPVPWAIGLGLHLLFGGLFGLAYGAVFEYVTHRANWLVGVSLSVLHLLVAGIFLGVVPGLHPMMPVPITPPGPFFSTVENGALVFTLAHLIFGAVVGTMYGPVVHARHLLAREV